MKKINFISAFLLVASFLSVSATNGKTDGAVKNDEILQCGVSNSQIKSYLEEGSHHHTVLWVSDIPGTCNSKAGIENCGTATVFVQNGIIVGHQDANGYCPD